MAFIECNCFSEVLGVNISFWVVLPQATTRQIGMTGKVSGGRHPTLYLLHGLSDDHTIWMRRTSIERYAADAGLAVVMPAVGRSFYTDMVNGYDYWTFVSEELIALAEQFFPLSPRREDRFVAGLSMGGYGAFKLALRCPEKFAAGASLSGAVDMANRNEKQLAADMKRDLDMVYGGIGRVKGSDNDLLHVASRLARSRKPRPKLYAWCGTEDFLIAQNRNFRDHARVIGLPMLYEEGPGDHQWKYWDEKIQRVIAWLPLRKR
jgi:S-formylglutathione hydrolase FrmB